MRVLLSGYYGYDNLGDEWLLETVITYLKKSNCRITVLSNKPQKTAKKYGVNAISRWNFFRFIKQLLHSELLLFGGGGLIQDLSGIKTPFYYLSQILLAKWLGKKIVMIGQGFGPVKNIFNRLLCEMIMPLVDLITTRDQVSFQWCQQLELEDSRVINTSDLVWLKPFELKKEIKKTTWLICLRSDWLGHKLPLWIESVKKRADKENVQLAFVAIGNTGDEALLELIKQQPSFLNCSFYNREQYLDAFNQAALIISMRYHGLLLGAIAGVPIIGIGKDAKLELIIESLHQSLATEYNVEELILLILKNYKVHQAKIINYGAGLKKEANKSVLALQMYLMNEN